MYSTPPSLTASPSKGRTFFSSGISFHLPSGTASGRPGTAPGAFPALRLVVVRHQRSQHVRGVRVGASVDIGHPKVFELGRNADPPQCYVVQFEPEEFVPELVVKEHRQLRSIAHELIRDDDACSGI